MTSSSYSQPKGLYPLFFTELWERFGFYMVQTILVLYLSQKLGLSDNHSFLLYGAFSSMMYLTPVLGGYLAGQFMGYRQAIILGSFLLILGYFLMAIPSKQALFLGMSLVILGNGFFKPNVSSIVGELYSREDSRRDGGFTIFYMGINIGGLLPPLFAGLLVERFGWGWGFSSAAFGLVIGLLIFLVCKKFLQGKGDIPHSSPLHQGAKAKMIFYSLLFIGMLILTGLFYYLFYIPKMTGAVLIAATLGCVATLLSMVLKEPREQKRKLFACLILIVISIGFWAVYNQMFTSLMLFADRNMGKQWLGFTIDAEFTQFFNPFFIILFSPFLGKLWVWLDGRGKNPSTPAKFTYGLLFTAISFFFLAAGTKFFNVQGVSSPWWLVGAYLLQTIGELTLSPVGLSMVTRLAPPHLVGIMMGIWFLTQSTAFAIGGILATWSSVPKDALITQASAIYSSAFWYYGLLTLVLSAISFLLIPHVKRLIKPSTEMPPSPR